MREAHPTLQDLESQQERTLENQPAHLVTFTCKDTCISISGLSVENVGTLNFTSHIKAT